MTQATLEEKAAALLAAGRLRVRRIGPRDLVVASCLSSDGATVYWLGYDPVRKEWRCTCPVPGRRRCSHLVALQLVVVAPSDARQSGMTQTTRGA